MVVWFLFYCANILFGDEFVFFGMFDNFQRKVDVQCGPVKVAGVQKLNITDLAYTGVFEPGKTLKRQKIFAAFYEYPKAMLGDIGYLSGRNVFSIF